MNKTKPPPATRPRKNNLLHPLTVLIFVLCLCVAFKKAVIDPKVADREIVKSVGAHPQPISKILNLKNINRVCILHPYAVRTGPAQEASLKTIFEDVDYSEWRNHIIKRHSSDYYWTLYFVKNGKIESASPLRPQRSLPYEMAENFRAGCYTLNTLCLHKTHDSNIIFKDCPHAP